MVLVLVIFAPSIVVHIDAIHLVPLPQFLRCITHVHIVRDILLFFFFGEQRVCGVFSPPPMNFCGRFFFVFVCVSQRTEQGFRQQQQKHTKQPARLVRNTK
eukprot:c10930_g1_i2.p3 GENE.c10930_g1_i2~~c10930_g1_i2.p3  ORF type:complete len:101 (-),score=22.27 c10930_g1_i2:44-346(-)